MYLYYQEPMWKQYVIDESKEFLQNKHTAEEKAVINGFLALIEKNWEKFSLELANLCIVVQLSRQKSKLFIMN